MFFFMDHNKIGVVDESTVLSSELSLPGDNSGTQSSDNKYDYSINFQRTFDMFKDNGNTSYQFSASFQESYVYNQFVQNGGIKNQSEIYTQLDYKNYYDLYEDPDFDTDAWINVFDNSNSEHTVKVFPKDKLEYHGLAMFTSDVGSTTIDFKGETQWRGFASDTAWSTQDYYQWAGAMVPYSTIARLYLDLTFS